MITSVTNALGQTNGFVYDLAGRLITRIHHDKSAETNRYDALGRLVSHTDAAGISATNWYNNQGLLAAVSNAFGRVVEYQYDVRDRLTNVVDAHGVSTTVVYDTLDRVVRRSVAGGGSEGFLYNARGLIAYTNPLGKVTRYGLDVFGRKLAETNANGEVTRYGYNPAGDLTMLIDGKGQTNQWTYDIYGHVTSVIDATGTTVTRYAYNADGRMTNRWTAAYGNVYYSYDPNGNMRYVSWDYSGGPGILARYAYDALNRLTNHSAGILGGSISYTSFGAVASEDGPWDDDTITHGYATNHLRNSLTVQQPNAGPWVQGYGYDAANRLQTLASPAGVYGYTYPNGASLINRITLPTGAYITNTFDSLGRLTGTFLKTSAHAVFNSHAYLLNDLGQRLRQTRADGSYVEYGYDNIGQVTSAVGREAGGGLRLHENLGFGYDLAGNLHYRTNNALVQTFGHNSLNELTSVSRAGTLTVAGAVSSPASSVSVNGLAATLYGDQTFARAGFVLADGTNTFTAAGQDSLGRTDSHTVAVRLPASAGYQYDGSGNLTSDGNLTFTYDWDGRLESYQVPYVWRVSFFYDGLGRLRFAREEFWDNTQGWVMRGEKRYLYDGYLAIQERDQNNVPTVTYTRGWDLSGTCCDAMGGIGGLMARTDHSALLAEAAEPHAYYHADGSGNVTMLVDSLDRPVATYLYDPYGNTVGQSGPLAEANIYRFSSKAYDARSGLYQFGRRFYAPSLQRWLNRDPIGIEGGINLYAYVRNRAANLFDPWGMEPAWDWDFPTDPAGQRAAGEGIEEGLRCSWNYMVRPVVDFAAPEASFVCNLAQAWLGEVQQGRDAGFSWSIEEGVPETEDEARWRQTRQAALEYVAARLGVRIGTRILAGLDRGVKYVNTTKFIKALRGIGGKGWAGDKTWRAAVRGVEKGGDFDTGRFGIPTYDEAIRLLKEAGVDVTKIRVEAHPPGGVSTHTYPHINYPAPSGSKGTIRIEDLP